MRWPSAVFYNGKLLAASSVANLRLNDLGKMHLYFSLVSIRDSDLITTVVHSSIHFIHINTCCGQSALVDDYG